MKAKELFKLLQEHPEWMEYDIINIYQTYDSDGAYGVGMIVEESLNNIDCKDNLLYLNMKHIKATSLDEFVSDYDDYDYDQDYDYNENIDI